MAGIALTVARIRPTLEMVKPLFETVPEVSSGKQVITGISGGIELNHISFRYNENMPLVLDGPVFENPPGTVCGDCRPDWLREVHPYASAPWI